MGFQTIKKTSAPDLVAKQILEQIESKALAPGSQLPSQRDLAALLGVGRSSIREAVNALVVLGYLEPIQGKGTFICETRAGNGSGLEKLAAAFKAGSIVHLMEARTMLECKSAGLAAERAEPAQIAKLEEILALMPEGPGEYAEFLEADLKFHRALAEATGNPVICEMTKLVLGKVKKHHLGLHTNLLSPSYKQDSIHSARMVLKAVAGSNPEEAAHWMATHLSAINKELEHIL